MSTRAENPQPSISTARRTHSAVRRRRGAHNVVGLLVTISLLAGGAAVAVVFTPRVGDASNAEGSSIRADSPRNQRTIELLGAILGRCHRVLVVHPAGSGTQTDIVLWLADTENVGTVDDVEVGVITHSSVLQTIAFHHLDGVHLRSEDLATLAVRRGHEQTRPAELTREILNDRTFPNRWRALETLSTSILAQGVSDLHATTVSDTTRGGELMRIQLRWGPESVDGPDQASALVDIGEP
jgi:hypothetical protein